MNRRSFLNSAMLAAAALSVDPERLLWTPKKTIFIPKPDPWDVIDKRIFGYVTRVGFPDAQWRQLNQGVLPQKSYYKQEFVTVAEYRRRFNLTREQFTEKHPIMARTLQDESKPLRLWNLIPLGGGSNLLARVEVWEGGKVGRAAL